MRTKACAAYALLVTAAAAQAQAEKKPDILFVNIEDLSPHRIGAYGNPVAYTLNFDRFAADGIRFDNAHCASAQCQPSRTALLTTRRPSSTGVYGNLGPYNERAKRAISEFPTVIDHFNAHGYETAVIGKFGHPGPQTATLPGNPYELIAGLERPPEHNADLLRGPAMELNRDLIKPGQPPPRAGDGYYIGDSGRTFEQEGDTHMALAAIELLKMETGKPKFIAMAIHAPHLPLIAPQRFFDLYRAEDMIIPRNNGALPDGTPSPETLARLAQIQRWGVWSAVNPHTLDQWKDALAAGYAITTFTDQVLGLVLNFLEESGKKDDTIVVVWSDHGLAFGEHFLFRKSNLYDITTRVVLMMRVPGVTTPGSVCRRPVESIEIFPTLFDLVGIPQMSHSEGISFKRLLENPEAAWKPAVMWDGDGGEGDCSRSIVTDRYRYTERVPASAWGKQFGFIELFDRENDPDEQNNLADLPEYASLIQDLSRQLHADWKELLPEKERAD